MNAVEVIERIRTNAETHTEQELRMIRVIEVGQWARQGDIAVQRVDEEPRTKRTADRQLAPGNTKGSRHILEGKVDAYEGGGDLLEGPLLIARERFTVTHPEHAHISLPSGTYRVTYQRDLQMEERARVMD